MLKPAAQESFIVYREAGRYGGWPANHGLWQWGDELVAGFTSTWYKQTTTDHRIDRSKPSYQWQARSLDGGRTWKTESELPFADATREAQPVALTEPLDFTAPDFALMFRFGSLHAGPSWFYTSADRCKSWRGPYSFAVEGVERICTRTDLIVLGPRDGLMFGSCAKQSDGKEGRVFCARTIDGGMTWKLVARIGEEPPPGGYAIMPSSVRLTSGAIITTIRRSDPHVSGFIECWRSDDLGATWKKLGDAVTRIGGNPPALVQLADGRLVLNYGYRHKPSAMRARISADEGRTWGPEIAVREGAFDGDMGYPRSVVRPDGRVMTVYYFNGPRDEDRAIEGTVWTPPNAAAKAPAANERPLVAVDRVRLLAAPGREQAMSGGKISGSKVSPSADFKELAEIKMARKPGEWSELKFEPRLAWDVIKNYPGCALYEEGVQPCAKPQIISNGQTITLKSATPHAWFRSALEGADPTRTPGRAYSGVISSMPSEKAAAKPLRPVLQGLVDQQIVSGAVALVTDQDKVLSLDTAGYSSLATRAPMREDAVFWLASMSKSITATALMMLVDEGKVSLGDPVEKYLPEFRGQQVAGGDGESHLPQHPITVREIMSHTSGLVLAGDKDLKRTTSLAENVAEYARKPLRQEPGTKYEYNNSGINTGGRIIEVVSGQPYADFLQQRLFGPLGMKDTTFWPNAEQAARLAHSARRKADKTGLEEVKLDQNVPPAAITRLSEGVSVPPAMIAEMGIGVVSGYARHYGEPAGGFFSTARDVGALCRMLLHGGVLEGRRYLSGKAIQQMSAIQTGGVPVNPQEAYGIGWSVKLRDEEGPSVGSFGHRGARRPVMWIDPKKGLAMVLLVARFDMTGEEQKIMYGSFLKAAIETYGTAR